MPRIEMYTKIGCPYCMRAKRLLKSKDAAFEEIDVTLGGEKRKEMLARAPGHTTVPSIFIDGRHIGGSDDLAALDEAGELDALLAA